jgi:hypothetical protein
MLLNPVGLEGWIPLRYNDIYEVPAISHRRVLLSEVERVSLACVELL